MSTPLQCSELSKNVSSILDLAQEFNANSQNVAIVEASLRKAIAPKFEIVFAGAFSAGKSMLINALLERELLYSAEGHATGTECYIEYAEPEAEKVVLTFLSEAEIKQQAGNLCQHLELSAEDNNITQPEIIDLLHQACAAIIEQEGGVSKSERAKKANALTLLLQGYKDNRDRIDAHKNNTYSMEEFNFSNLSQAATYARRGSNSAVLTRVKYYCHHPLLQDGNVLVDMPGIDAPVKKDAELTYSKIEHPDTSAVICVLKPASAGDMTSEETELMEKMKSNMGIRDRVFYVFNRIDQTWYAGQLRQRLDDLIQTEFRDNKRVYKTSGLLGFYGSQIKSTSSSDRFGLDSIFANSVKSVGGEEETPQFVSEFNNYCTSGKLTRTNFRVTVHGYETPNENYTRILSEFGTPLIEQLISDSGIEEFRTAITRYLTEEKRPQLFISLAEDLHPICNELKQHYLKQLQELDNQPQEIEAMKTQELTLLNQKLQTIGNEFGKHLENEVNSIITNQDSEFESDFQKLKARMVSRLDELVQTFSVRNAYSRATLSHPRHATAPLIAVLVEALYHFANELEEVLVKESEKLVHRFYQRLSDRLKQQDYYRALDRLLREDTGIQAQLQELETKLTHSLNIAAKVECDRYVRESARFYDEGTFSIYQFRQTLQQTSQGYDCDSMVKAEPAIRQLLKLDFEPKVFATIRQNFRQAINQTLKTELLPMAEKQADTILQYYPQARALLEQTLEQEAITKIALNQKMQQEVKEKIAQYNQSANEFNNCLRSLQLFEYQLPIIERQKIDIKIEPKMQRYDSNNQNHSHIDSTTVATEI